MKIERFVVRGNTTQFTEYSDMSEIIANLEENGYFHDGTVECIGHDSDSTVIAFRHYQDSEHIIRRLIFTGNVELTMNLDLLVRCIYEINVTVDDRIDAFFDGTGIIVKADNVKLVIQELID